MRNTVKQIEINIRPTDTIGSITVIFHEPNMSSSNTKPMAQWQICAIVESLKAKGFDTPQITYSSKYYGFQMTFKINKYKWEQ